MGPTQHIRISPNMVCECLRFAGAKTESDQWYASCNFSGTFQYPGAWRVTRFSWLICASCKLLAGPCSCMQPETNSSRSIIPPDQKKTLPVTSSVSNVELAQLTVLSRWARKKRSAVSTDLCLSGEFLILLLTCVGPPEPPRLTREGPGVQREITLL